MSPPELGTFLSGSLTHRNRTILTPSAVVHLLFGKAEPKQNTSLCISCPWRGGSHHPHLQQTSPGHGRCGLQLLMSHHVVNFG